ncbi:MAG: transposase [Planctomycetota bacterium]|jgi:transposase-like protein
MTQRIIKRYSNAFKRQIVRQIEQGQLSIAQAQRRYDIGGATTIPRWLNAFGTNPHTCKMVRISTPEEVDQLKDLHRQKQELESALAQAHLKILALESTLAVAEQHFGVDLKKNFVTGASTTPERP